MKKITALELIEMVRNQKGCTFATIKTDTNPKPKKSCPFPNVHKISKLNVMIGFDYENSVNNQRSREEIETEFKSAPRRWGKRVDLKTVEHNGNIYLTTATLNHLDTVYKDEQGLEIPKDQLTEHLPKKSSSSRQETNKQVVYRDFNVSNITEISINKEKYEVC